MAFAFIAAAIVGYLLGSIPPGYLLGRLLRGIDVRSYGSGKTGGTNVLRTLGLRAAVVVIVVDVAKGTIAVLLARLISDEPYVQAVAGLGALAGHIWPLFLRFRGGRGVSAAYGALLGMNPLAALALIPLALVIIGVSRYMSLMSVGMSFVTAALFVGLAAADIHPWAYGVFASTAGAVIVVVHKDNIQRLLAGQERKIGQKEQIADCVKT